MQNDNQNTNQKFLGEYMGQVRRTLVHLLVLGTFVVLSSFLAGNIFIIPGFLFGYVASIIYYMLICRRVLKSAEMSPDQAVSYMRTGWIIRLSFIVSVLLIAHKIPGLKFSAAVAGLFSLQIVIMLQAIVVVTVGLISRYKDNFLK